MNDFIIKMKSSNKIFLIVITTFILLNICKSSMYDLQGFGSDMNITVNQEVMVSSQLQLGNSIRSNILIRFQPNLSLRLNKIVLLKNISNLILLGPATLYNEGIYVQNSKNIIIRNLRVLNASIYGIFVYHSTNVVVDHATILDAGRTDVTKGKCIDITEQAKNVTVSNSILGFTSPVQQLIKHKGLLAANFLQGPVENVSLHHNLYYCVYQRSPQISSTGLFDMRENIVFNYTEYGSRIRNGAFGNFIGNRYIGGKKDPLVFADFDRKVYSIRNTWKQDCRVQETIQDVITHQQFSVPYVTSKSINSVAKDAGCLIKEVWELRIYSEISKFL